MTNVFTGCSFLAHVFAIFRIESKKEFIQAVYRIHYGVIESMVGTLDISRVPTPIITNPYPHSSFPSQFPIPLNNAIYIRYGIVIEVWDPTEQFFKEYRRRFLDNINLLSHWDSHIRLRLVSHNPNVVWLEYQTDTKKLKRITKPDYRPFK